MDSEAQPFLSTTRPLYNGLGELIRPGVETTPAVHAKRISELKTWLRASFRDGQPVEEPTVWEQLCRIPRDVLLTWGEMTEEEREELLRLYPFASELSRTL